LLREKDKRGQIPLHIAIAQGRPLQTVRLLEELAPETLHAAGPDGAVALHVAARSSDEAGGFDTEEWLVSENRRALAVEDSNGRLPIHVAARFSTRDIVLLLAAEYQDGLVSRANDGMLPLHIAARCAELEVVQVLANIVPAALGTPTSDGMLPMHIAARYAELEVVQWLAHKHPAGLGTPTENDRMLPLHVAVRYGNLEVVQVLSNKSPAAVGTPAADGMLPLHVAAHCDKLEVVQFLAIQRPDALEARTADGMLPVHVAAHSDEASLDVVYALARMCPRSLAPTSRPCCLSPVVDSKCALFAVPSFPSDKGKPHTTPLRKYWHSPHPALLAREPAGHCSDHLCRQRLTQNGQR
jgi:ankyrin repeat protein